MEELPARGCILFHTFADGCPGAVMSSSISIMKVGAGASEMTKGLRNSLMAERTVWAGVFTRPHFMEEAHGRVRIASSLHPDPNLMIW
jgi:hypothetical protein